MIGEMKMIKIDKDREAIVIPETLPIIPVRNTVFFPHQFIPLAIGRPKSIKLIESALRGDSIIGVVAQRDGTVDDPSIYRTAVKVLLYKE
jgi:ATP-dependent Lon protease